MVVKGLVAVAQPQRFGLGQGGVVAGILGLQGKEKQPIVQFSCHRILSRNIYGTLQGKGNGQFCGGGLGWCVHSCKYRGSGVIIGQQNQLGLAAAFPPVKLVQRRVQCGACGVNMVIGDAYGDVPTAGQLRFQNHLRGFQ